MRSTLQQTLLVSLRGVLRPIISLCLKCGTSYGEFSYLVRAVFVSVASEEYGLRGRPTNISRIAAMTGISRKEIKRIRQEIDEARWSPAMEVSPVNLMLHFWHFDKDFCSAPGDPAPLPIDGAISFAELARRYAGDIPAGALREELKRADVISEEDGLLTLRKRYFQPKQFDEDFIRGIAFSIQNMACTVVHNAELVSRPNFNSAMNVREGRFERFAWSEGLTVESRRAFKTWVREEGARFIEVADEWIGQNESIEAKSEFEKKNIGVGVYLFEED